jgi:hypothetical protein
MPRKPKIVRRKKLIAPKFQLQVAGFAIAIAVVAVMTLMVVLNQAFVDMIDKGWLVPGAARAGWMTFLFNKLLLALAIVVPVALSLAVLLSHRVAGPMYRFRVFLTDVKEGRQVEPCRIRDGDEYQEFCVLINEVTAPLRELNAVRDDIDVEVESDERRRETVEAA